MALFKRKWVAGILAVTILLSLCACGKQDAPATTATPTENTTEEVITEVTTVPETTVPETTAAPQPTSPPPAATAAPYVPIPMNGAVPESGRVSGSYFDDAVFVGDSVSLKLSYYEAAVDLLGGAQFLTSGSLGSGNALWDVTAESVHPTYQGNKQLIEDSIAQMGAKKVYIMLGMNDIALYGIDTSVSNMVTLVNRIRAKSPGVAIYVQSMTPLTSTSNLLSSSGHNPNSVAKYNAKLLETALAQGWYFVDVASVMTDANGYLFREYCSDPDNMGIHFTNTGCGVWIDYLCTHTVG